LALLVRLVVGFIVDLVVLLVSRSLARAEK
jgi:hypothetical protein